MQIDDSSQHRRKLVLHSEKCQTRYVPGLELYQHIYIAVGPEVIPDR